MEAKSASQAAGFVSFNDEKENDEALRIEEGQRLIKFGVSFLDEALLGISHNDLVVLGAPTGKGKSQLATLIALHNCRAGKRVHYFALEAEKRNISRRLRFQKISEMFYADTNKPRIHLDFQEWRFGLLSEHLSRYEREIDEAPDLYPNLYIYYRDKDFGIKDFQRAFFAISQDTDLIIVDHLHYFDFEDSNENKATKEIMKTIMDCVQISGKPVVLISHVRKRDKKTKQILPDIEDFHGSSEISKICTKAITLAPDPGSETKAGNGTLISILKNRNDGSRTRFTAKMVFDYSKQNYGSHYNLGQMNFDGSEWKEIPSEDVPFWSKKSVRI